MPCCFILVFCLVFFFFGGGVYMYIYIYIYMYIHIHIILLYSLYYLKVEVFSNEMHCDTVTA